MFEGIKDKKVLITGATGGMGTAMAELFADYGACVGLHYRSNKEGAEALLRTLRLKKATAEIFQADLLDQDSIKDLVRSFIEKFGGIDVLINNAGAVYNYAHFSELTGRTWQDTFDLNAKAPFFLSGEIFDHMKEHGGGRIINISSVNVKYGGSAKSMHYVASKAALESFALGFAREGAKYNILVNSIRCGVIETFMRKKVAGYNEEDWKHRVGLIPLGRAGKPADISRMTLFLASEAGNFITGETFTVAGGD